MRTEIKNLKERNENIERNINELYGRKLKWESFGWMNNFRVNGNRNLERKIMKIITSRGEFLMNGYGEITTWEEQDNIIETGDKRFSTMKSKIREERLEKLLG